MLILVLWSLALLGTLVAGLGARVAMALELTQRLNAGLQESYAALAAVPALARLLASDASPGFDGRGDDWAQSRDWTAAMGSDEIRLTLCPLPAPDGGEAALGVIDEERKVSLNGAPEELLQRLVQQVGQLNEGDALAIAQAIADWRDKDHEKRPDGAESFYYQARDPGYDCKDGPFELVEELRLVKGMTSELYVALAPFVTVHGSGRVNLNTAPEAVVRALGFSSQGTESLLYYRAGEDNQFGTMDDRLLTAETAIAAELASVLPAEDQPQLATLLSDEVLTVKSEAFRFAVEVLAQGSQAATTAQAVIRRDGTIEAWTQL